VPAVAVLVATALCSRSPAAEPAAVAEYRKAADPILDDFCVTCHGGKSPKAGVAFDRADVAGLVGDRDLWLKALKMLRAGMMPPKGKDRPSAAQLEQLETWIKRSAFGIDPKNPDPGRVTLRRLNRVEYRNTVRDLTGVDFDVDAAFPPDDTGHGFDTIGDVLSMSPLLLEKYVSAAREVVAKAVPAESLVPVEKRIGGQRFGNGNGDGPLALSYSKPATATHTFNAEHAGKYQLLVELNANETFVDGVFDYNKCRLVFKADGKALVEREFTRQGGKAYHFEFDQDWAAGKHELTFELTPLTPNEKQVRNLTLRVVAVTVRGPLEKEHWVRPANYRRFFPESLPADPDGRRAVARTILTEFATRAFRRSVDDATVDRLVKLAEGHYSRDGRTFESGVAQAMTVVLASPRFLFREEGTIPGPPGTHPLVDEYALASRLSYFLWSTMPDDELFRLAREGKLRANLPAQLKRMLADPRSDEFVRNFVGQWLQTRSVDSVQINAPAILSQDAVPDPKAQERRTRFRELIRKENLTEAEKKEVEELRKAVQGGFRRFAQYELTGDLRRAMRQETEMLFGHIVHDDRSLLEIIDCDYTFLNEKLARFYGIAGVTGDRMRLVKLPPDSPRGGVLTQASVLTITSNPDRTSPVKRGLFILDALLGTPPPPPPPNLPTLEQAETHVTGRKPTLREQLAAHRAQPLCSSCHNRMDPPGLALEHFNALGLWRDTERGQPIESTGELITGEKFSDVRALKKVLVTDRRLDFYRCLTEKMLVYALGRGLDYYDVEAVDEIVARLEASGGRPSALLTGIIESAPFQKRRAAPPTDPPAPGPARPAK
jgi:cytochrome c5